MSLTCQARMRHALRPRNLCNINNKKNIYVNFKKNNTSKFSENKKQQRHDATSNAETLSTHGWQD